MNGGDFPLHSPYFSRARENDERSWWNLPRFTRKWRDEIMKSPPKKNIRKPGIKTIGKKDQSEIPKWKPGKTSYKTSYIPGSKWLGPTWWLIPLSKWDITPVLSGLTLLIPCITGVITHLLSGMSHQVGNPYTTQWNPQWKTAASETSSKPRSIQVTTVSEATCPANGCPRSSKFPMTLRWRWSMGKW